MAFNATQEENIAAYGGYGGGVGMGGGGAWMAILLVVIVLFILFDRKDGHHGGYGAGYPFAGGNCGPCVQPTFKDESNYEEESHLKDKLCCIDKDIWKTDSDVWKSACETQQIEHCEAEKTRDLIRCEAEKNLRDKLAESQMLNLTLKNEMFNERKFDKLENMIGALACETPKRPPFYACGGEPTVYPYPPHNYPQMSYGRRDNCGCNDGFRDGGIY